MTELTWKDFCNMLSHLSREVHYAKNTVVVSCTDDSTMDALADVVEQVLRTHGHDVDPLVVIRTAVLEDDAVVWYRGMMK